MSLGKRLVILISGRGSNMKALIDAFPNDVVRVISNVPDAPGLEIAKTAGVETIAFNHKDYKTRADFELALTEAVNAARPDVICLAGFMRVLGTTWFERIKVPTLNIHPSLLPKHKGLNTHQAALDAGDIEAGCSVHLVTPELDDGEVLLQKSVPVLPNDTADSLAARVLAEEHGLYIKAVKKIAARV